MTVHGKELVQMLLALIGAFCFGQVYGAWMWSAAFSEVNEDEQ